MRKLKLEELGRHSVDAFKQQDKTRITVVLDNIRSGMNVGAVFRTADALALEQIVLTGISPCPPHKEIHKSAIGATRSVDWVYEENIEDALQVLRSRGYLVLGVEQTTASISLTEFRCPTDMPIAVVMGNEVEGLSDVVLKHLDQALEIEQYGTKHSLNVAVCAGIVLWELSRQLRSA